LSNFTRLADLDRSVLAKLVIGSVADVRRRYGWHGGLADGSSCLTLRGRGGALASERNVVS
jgi:hypothetical protein